MKTPIQDMLIKYAGQNADRFHMPGHKGKSAAFHREIMTLDVTETAFTDNLYTPQGPIYEAQRLAASYFNARRTFFLVNGATSGIAAMLLSMKRDTLLVVGAAHRSIVCGVALRGLRLVCVAPFIKNTHEVHQRLKDALDQYPSADLLVVSPDYYGVCHDIALLSACAEAYGAKVYVDAAHGGHFGVCRGLPPSPAALGASMWVSGAHKTLGALTQGAYLHVAKNSGVDDGEILRCIMSIQTSSPSYLILSSLDHTRALLEENAAAWEETADMCRDFAAQVNQKDGLFVYDETYIQNIGAYAQDPTRLTVDVSGRGLTGFEAHELLMEQNIVAEMSDLTRIVFIVTPYDEKDKLERLKKALIALPRKPARPFLKPFDIPETERKMELRAAFFSNKETVSLDAACGRICAEPVGVYPPGVPLVLPGEMYTPEVIARLIEAESLGAQLFGVFEGVAVVSE